MKKVMSTAVCIGAALSFLTLPSDAGAQVGVRIGGGRGGIGIGSPYYGRPYGGYYGGGYGYGPGGYYGRGGVGIGIGAPGYYGYGMRNGYGYYAQPGVVVGGPSAYQSLYPPVIADPAPGVADATFNDGRGRVVVIVPPNAEVWWNGTRSTLTGNTRRYSTLPLSADGAVQKFQARWTGPDGQLVTQTREVRAMPNTTATVDFTRPQSDEKTPAIQ